MSEQNKFMPFNRPFGNAIGRGKDNIVVPLKMPLEKKGEVLKWNHEKYMISKEEHFNRLLYKKKKYEMLRFFLGDFIPKSDFVLGNKLDGKKLKIKEFIVQSRVPNVKISELSEDQKSDPRLLYNMHLLIQKLMAMYKIVKQVNNSIGKGKLDVKLDLGGLSKSIEEKIKNNEEFDFISMNKGFMNSPNLLVDPESMQLSCVDFDVGNWSEEKEATLTLVKMLTENNKQTMDLIQKPQKS